MNSIKSVCVCAVFLSDLCGCCPVIRTRPNYQRNTDKKAKSNCPAAAAAIITGCFKNRFFMGVDNRSVFFPIIGAPDTVVVGSKRAVRLV